MRQWEEIKNGRMTALADVLIAAGRTIRVGAWDYEPNAVTRSFIEIPTDEVTNDSRPF